MQTTTWQTCDLPDSCLVPCMVYLHNSHLVNGYITPPTHTHNKKFPLRRPSPHCNKRQVFAKLCCRRPEAQWRWRTKHQVTMRRGLAGLWCLILLFQRTPPWLSGQNTQPRSRRIEPRTLETHPSQQFMFIPLVRRNTWTPQETRRG